MEKEGIITRIMTQIDIFGMEHRFLFDKNRKHKSFLGGVVSLSVYILIGLGFFSFRRDLVEKNFPQSSLQQNLFKSRKVQDKFYNYYVDPQIVNVRVVYVNAVKSRNEKGDIGFEFHSKNLRVEVCDLKRHFGNYPELFENEPLSNLNCIYPEDSQDLNMKGSFGTEEFNYFTVELSPCKNSTDSSVFCKSREEIEDSLNGGFFVVNNIDTVFDPKNFTNAGMKIRRNFYTTLFQKYFKEWTLYFRNVEYVTDIGWLMEDPHSEKYLRMEDVKELVDLRENPTVFFQAIFRMSFFKDIHLRRYTKVQEVVANVGGLIKGIIMVVTSFLFTYQQSKYYIDLANKVFIFCDNPPTETRKIVTPDKRMEVSSDIKAYYSAKDESPSLNNFMISHKTMQPNTNISTDKIVALLKGEKIIKNKRKLKPSCSEFFRLSIPFYTPSNKKSLYYRNIISIMQEKNNVHHLLNMYEEFIVFKNILLKDSHKTLYNVNSKFHLFSNESKPSEDLKLSIDNNIDTSPPKDVITQKLLEELNKKYDVLKI